MTYKEKLWKLEARRVRAIEAGRPEAAAAYSDAIEIVAFNLVCPDCKHHRNAHEFNFHRLYPMHVCKFMVNETTMCNCHCNMRERAISVMKEKPPTQPTL